MITLIPEGMERRAFLEEEGVKTTRDQALQELAQTDGLFPVCLITYPMFGIAVMCLNTYDVQWIDSQKGEKEWYLLEVNVIQDSFPNLLNAVRIARRKK